MGVLKAHEVERFLDGLEGRAPFCVMAYGPDRGLVADCLARFAKATGVDTTDALSTVVIDGATLAADNGRLRDELNGPGLFGGRRLVRLREAGNEKRLVEAVALALAEPSPDAYLAIEGGDLKRGSALLKGFERSRSGFALPCYVDDERAVERTVDRMLGDAKVAIEPEARAALVEALGGDRLATRSEIEKLLLYCEGAKRITEDDVAAIVGDAGAVAADRAVDGALSGDVASFERAYARLLAARTSPFLVLRDLAQQLQAMERAWEGSASAERAGRRLEEAGGRIHFRRLPALRAALRRLDAPSVATLLARTTATVLESRERPALEPELVRQLCLDVARPAGNGNA